MKEKIFVLDTNVLLEDPEAINAFGKNRVGVPIVVLEELDNIKAESSFRGRNARESIRIFDNLRNFGDFKTGIKLESGGVLQILFEKGEKSLFKNDQEVPDNKILRIIKVIKDAGEDIEFITKDINLRIKANLMGIQSSDYRGEVVTVKSLYKGWRELGVSSSQLAKDMPDDLRDANKENPFIINEFALLRSGSSDQNIKLFRYLGGGRFKFVESPDLRWSLHPKNIQQKMALDVLFDPEIKLATLIGPAGTGKTFLTLVAALHEILINNRYEKFLVTRPVVPLGPDIGYLPGDIQEKLHTWMQPIYDNMDYILHSVHQMERQGKLGVYHEQGFKYAKGKKQKRGSFAYQELPTLEDLVAENKVSMEAITYMRGRSIPYQFILIDEVQNLTPHEVKTLISRVGEGSKVVLTGDPYQIDAAHLDFSSNGLVVTSERFKGQNIFGTVLLEITERSELSRLAAELL